MLDNSTNLRLRTALGLWCVTPGHDLINHLVQVVVPKNSPTAIYLEGCQIFQYSLDLTKTDLHSVKTTDCVQREL